MSTIFTKIINREIPAHFIYEDDLCVAILDKFPSVRGQALVIPKKSVDYIFELDSEMYQHIFMITKRIAVALDTALETERTCIVVEGFEVPHAHIKLYPIPKGESELVTKLGTTSEATDEELALIVTQITAALDDDTSAE